MGEMKKEEALDWLYRLRSEMYVYMPKEWLVPMNNALDMAIDAFDHEQEIINALGLSIHVQSLESSMLEEEKHKINKIITEIEERLKDARDIIDNYRESETEE